jgi:hypothetical protein
MNQLEKEMWNQFGLPHPGELPNSSIDEEKRTREFVEKIGKIQDKVFEKAGEERVRRIRKNVYLSQEAIDRINRLEC